MFTGNGPGAEDENRSDASSGASLTLAQRMMRLQSLLCVPLPLFASNLSRIFKLVEGLLPSSSKMSLLLLLLPRVGRLTDAIRLVVSNAPECMWPFAQVFCGAETMHHISLRSALSTHMVEAVHERRLLHWQLLHSTLLLHLYFSTHAPSVLTSATASLFQKPAIQHEEAKDHVEKHPIKDVDDDIARKLLEPLLPSSCASMLLRRLAVMNDSDIVSYVTAQSQLLDAERSALYQQLYLYLLDQFVSHHHPRDFLRFIPSNGSAQFYLPHIHRCFTLHAHDQWRRPADPFSLNEAMSKPTARTQEDIPL